MQPTPGKAGCLSKKCSSFCTMFQSEVLPGCHRLLRRDGEPDSFEGPREAETELGVEEGAAERSLQCVFCFT